MKKYSSFIIYIFIGFGILIITIIIALSILYQNLKSSTPQLSSIAQRVGKPAFAIAFNYSKNTDRQLYQFSKNIGLENNPRTQQPIPPLGEIGARGFFIVDMLPQYSEKIFSTLDEVLNDFLSFIDESTSQESTESLLPSDENEFFDPNPVGNHQEDSMTQPEESPFARPLTSLIEELWNGQTFLIGGATQLQLSLKDSILLSIEPQIKKSIQLSSNTIKNLVIKNAPLSIQNFLVNHAIDISIESMEYDTQKKVNHSQIIISVSDPSEFLNSICSVKINPWDFCGRFSFQRNKFRKNVENILSLLNKDFKIKLDTFWVIKGHTFIFSNQKDFVIKATNPNTPTDSNNILTSVSASGADFLLPTESSKNFSSISFLFDMIRSQNKMIDFSERMKNKSAVLSDYFSSPNGEVVFSNIENTINKLTSYSEKASLTLDTNGDILIPKIRLYSPSGDLFLHQGKDLNPEVINSIRIFITKAISFGNYLLPRGLIPMPGPFVQKNGKWTIIHSEILVKSIAPYLESVDPYIDNYEDPTKL